MLANRYELLRKIGSGGMAVVYQAYDTSLDRKVAIKLLREEYVDDPDFIRRFQKEAQAVARLSHQNIVNIYDFGESDGLTYLVMEYVEGSTLKEIIAQNGPLPISQVLDYSIQLCYGMAQAHSQQIVHKDIKPHNIMVDHNHVVKITDFGIAQAMNNLTITHNKGILGSAHYFSPEQARGGFTDAKTDLYSLGILTYEMVTGRLPFEGESAISIAMQHLETEPVRPSVFNPSIPKSLETVILKAMKKEQSERYQTATQMLIDLKKVYVGSEVRYDEGDEFTKKFTPINPQTASNKNGAPQGAKNGTPQRRSQSSQGKAPVKKQPSRAELAKAKKKKKKGDTLGIVAGIFAGIAVIALAIWGWSFMTGGSKNEVECPELVNHTCAEALELIEGTKLKIVQENGKEIQADDEGIIVTQDPKSGKKIKNNAKITVTLGDQPATMEKIPSVAGMTEADATSALKALKFDVTVERQDNSDVAAGRVISTHPAAGTSASEGSVVTIYVSNGNKNDNTENEYTIVPDLLGKTENEAKSALERADLKLGEVQQVASEKEKGTVVKQSEAEGNRVKKNKAIDIRISSGKAATSATPTPSAKPSASASPSSTPKPSSTPTSSGDDEPNEGGNNGTNED